jgi:hypothetical protein
VVREGAAMMGERTVMQESVFYEFSLEPAEPAIREVEGRL